MFNFYNRIFKRACDFILSLIAILLLLVPLVVIAIIVKVDSPGPVFFLQKRIGIHKTYFNIIKFRSMSVSAPKDTPTHQLTNAESYLTTWQKFIRKTSIDELPQLFNILVGHMSIIGPRPALWNQYDLIEERDKYGANDIKPGLTGWAQINGRDELPIAIKAKFDGEYASVLREGSFDGLFMDLKCFYKTVGSVLKFDGVIEGGPDNIISDNKEEVLK